MIPRPTSFVENPALTPPKLSKCRNCLSSAQHVVADALEKMFYVLGKAIARYPLVWILMSLLLTALCSLGLMNFRKENNALKLWIPADSSQRINSDWLWANYPPETRFASLIFVSERDILDPDVIRAMYNVHKSVEQIRSKYNHTWEDVCVRIPVVKAPESGSFSKKRRKRASAGVDSNSTSHTDKDGDDGFTNFDDPFFEEDSESLTDEISRQSDGTDLAEFFSLNFYPEPYCKVVSSMPTACFENSILELWASDGSYQDEVFQNLTRQDILQKVNEDFQKSGVFLTKRNFSELLSDISYDDQGRIVSAKATVMRWFSKLNAVEALRNPVIESGEPIDAMTLEFEGDFIKVLLDTTAYPDGLASYPNVQRSFGDIAGSTILGDLKFLTVGFGIVFYYVTLMLGKCSCVEQRYYLSFAGIMGVIMGVFVSYGMCSAMGLFFGPMHNVLPFLFLGIGIDDMFVFVQSWEVTDKETDRNQAFEHRMGLAVSHAGVAVTVTSLTDVLAFAVGGSTVLPALRSFCLFASVGIVAIYLFQSTFFVACLSLDQRRVEAFRNGCCPCIRHEAYQPNRCASLDVGASFFKCYGRVLLTTPAKVAVALLTLVITGVAIWGNVLLEQRFEPTWFLPPDSYLAQWFQQNQKYFPFGGDRVTIWCSEMDVNVQMVLRLQSLVDQLKQQTDIVDNVDTWTDPFMDYVGRRDFVKLKEDHFQEKLTQFLFSPRGAKYRPRFVFNGTLTCGSAAPKVLLNDITFRHRLFSGPSEHIPAMNRVKQLIDGAQIKGKVFALSQGYAAWETDEVISHELYRNLLLAIVCIFLSTLVLIGNVICSLMVLLMVLLSLVDVCGFMHFWNLTIDTVSCVNLVIAIGLCVDFSVHVAHRFLVETSSSRIRRIQDALMHIGPAVLNGGFSTFLAFILLAFSQSHVFSTFFKIFFLVVVFGLFHGLTVLPVILAQIGPKSQRSASVSRISAALFQDELPAVAGQNVPLTGLLKVGAEEQYDIRAKTSELKA